MVLGASGAQAAPGLHAGVTGQDRPVTRDLAATAPCRAGFCSRARGISAVSSPSRSRGAAAPAPGGALLALAGLQRVLGLESGRGTRWLRAQWVPGLVPRCPAPGCCGYVPQGPASPGRAGGRGSLQGSW